MLCSNSKQYPSSMAPTATSPLFYNFFHLLDYFALNSKIPFFMFHHLCKPFWELYSNMKCWACKGRSPNSTEVLHGKQACYQMIAKLLDSEVINTCFTPSLAQLLSLAWQGFFRHAQSNSHPCLIPASTAATFPHKGQELNHNMWGSHMYQCPQVLCSSRTPQWSHTRCKEKASFAAICIRVETKGSRSHLPT